LKTKVLYIEDEQFLGRIVMETLEKQGYEVRWEIDGSNVLDLFKSFNPEICVVDIMLPGIDGYTLSRSIRGLNPDIPIIFLTAKTETPDIIKGFKSGGTDYIRKPFSIEELIVRIENQINIKRDGGNKPTLTEEITLGIFRFVTDQGELYNGQELINLSHRETQILTMLAANRNTIVDRKDLLMAVWGDDSFFNSRNLDVYIRKLRSYLTPDGRVGIKTLRGKGYLFIVP
jgi:DNA-binding response OmpR family regulator